MSELPSPTELVRRYGRPAKKSLGQHFLTEVATLDRVIDVARLAPGSRVVEIGPGPGTLTTRLLAAGHSVEAVEMDDELVHHLGDVFAGAELTVVHGSALDIDLEPMLSRADAVVANLPYNVGAPILFRLLDAEHAPARMALMFQREVADRIVSSGPGRSFGPLGVACHIRYDTRLALKLPPGAFRPPPKVDSAVVRLLRRENPRCGRDVEMAARAIARTAFGHRRKMLRKTLLPHFEDPNSVLAMLDLPPTSRPEELSVDDFVRLGEFLGT